MRMSQMFGHTLRETPGDAETPAHALLLRGGYIDQLMGGVYSFLPLGNRVRLRIEQIIREEMDRAGAQEVHLPAIQPVELWQQSGRDRMDVLFRLQDRRERQLVLGPTHEEVITRLFADHAFSYRDLPVTLYQIQTKFRDELRPRGGLVRVREFTMKDAYSFDVDDAGLDASYDAMFQAYRRIYARCGVPTIPVEADSGAIGGKGSQEFIFLTDTGEDTIIFCDTCAYAANQEKAAFVRPEPAGGDPLPLEEVETPGATTIEGLAQFLGIETRQTAKAVFFMATPKAGGDPEPVFAVVRGDLDINEVKLSNALGGAALRPMQDDEIQQYGLVAGYASPIGLREGVRLVADLSIPDAGNLVAGANRPGWHLRNVNHGRDWTAEVVADIAGAEAGHGCAACADAGRNGTLRTSRGIEMGHVFRLEYTYTTPMDITVQDAEGNQLTPTMGCYGIGVERILSAAVEAHHDDAGITWPVSLAPYDVHIVGIGLDRDDALREDADRLFEELQDAGLQVLFDDREERPGVKFNDADLIGVPLRLTVSSRNHGAGVVEYKPREAAEPESVARNAIVQRILDDRPAAFAALTIDAVEGLARR